MPRPNRFVFAAMSVASVTPGFLAHWHGSSDSNSPRHPRIVATPDSVMVDSTTVVIGKGFPVGKPLSIDECSVTEWVVVAQDPCAKSNVLNVTTDSHGRFKHSFTVQTCPVASNTPGFSQKCYLGEPVPQGVDTENLEGATSITVTGP